MCMDEDGKIIGDKFPRDVFDSNSMEINYKFGVKGEKWGFHRTDVLRDFSFPCIDGVKFVPEGVVWSAIAREYKTRFVNEKLRIYYQDDGNERLTCPDLPGRHAVSRAFWHRSVLNNDIEWFRYAPARFLLDSVHYARFSFHERVNVREQIKNLKGPLARMLYGLGLPFGWLVYKKDKKRRLSSWRPPSGRRK